MEFVEVKSGSKGKTNILKEALSVVFSSDGIAIDLKAITTDQKIMVATAIQDALSVRSLIRGTTEWEETKQKEKDKVLGRLYNETIYNTLLSYNGESKNIVARKLWYLGHYPESLNEPVAKLVAFAELMGEKPVVEVTRRNGPAFTKAIIRIFEAEYTLSTATDDAQDRVAYLVAKSIGSREGNAANLRLKTIQESGLFSESNLPHVRDEVMRLLDGLIAEDDQNKKL
ncbi:MAG: hypothetical protein KGH66_02430 [Candidatus Micrarchaeota archaeon]|nr:hypothetical protein [Candidatus Micrarchaeota archaeon]